MRKDNDGLAAYEVTRRVMLHSLVRPGLVFIALRAGREVGGRRARSDSLFQMGGFTPIGSTLTNISKFS